MGLQLESLSSLREVSDEPLWTPTEKRIERSTLARYAKSVGHDAHDYAALWQWSVDDLEGFWQSVCDFFEVRFDTPPDEVLGSREMPGRGVVPRRAPVLRRARASATRTPTRWPSATPPSCATRATWTWAELRAGDGRDGHDPRATHGVGEGDRVAAYLPNIPETVAALPGHRVARARSGRAPRRSSARAA